MTGPGASDEQGYPDFARRVQTAFGETRLHSPQAVPAVEERLRGKLATLGIALTPDILRALAYAIVNDRGADA